MVGDGEALAGVFAAVEVSLACGLTNYSSDRRVVAAEALFLEGRLPRLPRLLAAGWVDWAKLDAFVHDTGHLDVAVANAVERIVIGDLPGEQPECPHTVDVLADPADPGRDLPAFVRLTTPQLRAAIAAAISAVDAEAAARRARTAREGRGVSCEAGLDGMATLTADLAVEAAAAVWNALTTAAKTAKAAATRAPWINCAPTNSSPAPPSRTAKPSRRVRAILPPLPRTRTPRTRTPRTRTPRTRTPTPWRGAGQRWR